MIHQTLTTGWKLRRTDETEWLPAEVPGSVFSTLLKEGRIPDPYYRENEGLVRSASYFDYEYTLTFTPSENLLKQEKVELIFEGIDTLGEIFLNRIPIGKTINMHHAYCFDVKNIVTEGQNHLSVILRSPSRYTEEQHRRLPLRSPHGSMVGSAYLRKAHYMFGWDWGPQLPDLGIWKRVYLRGYSHALLTDVWIQQNHTKNRVELDISVHLSSPSTGEVTIEIELEEPSGDTKVTRQPLQGNYSRMKLNIQNPELWFPNGYGKQPLYRVGVRLRNRKEVLDERTYRIGLRTIVLDRSPFNGGRSFKFRVNGIPIFAKGADFIPMDNLLPRQTPERIRTLIRDCARAHFNMIRVWGGGIYPEEALLDACDEYGILLWQDLMFACMVYDLNPEFLESIRREVVEQVTRMRHRACLALWCGNNEIEWMLHEGRFDSCLNPKIRADYYRLFECVLPDIVRSLDPVTPCWGSSPSSGYDSEDPNDERFGDMHYWEVWHGLKPFTAYRSKVPRFMSEFGIQSFPPLPTIESFTIPQDRNIFSPVMENHQKNAGANGKIFHYIAETFRFPKNFASLVYLSQLVQAEGIRCGVEHWRRHRDVCGGTLYWQLNDCWPGASWSSIDYFGRWKALHYYAKRFFAPVLLSLEDEGEKVYFHVTNDTMDVFKGSCRYRLCLHNGECLREESFLIEIPPAMNQKVAVVDLSNVISIEMGRRVYLRYTLLDEAGKVLQEDSLLFVKPKHFEWMPSRIRIDVAPDGNSVLVRSDGYTKFAALHYQGRDILFDDNFFDLYPGEEKIVQILQQTSEEPSAQDISVFSIVDSFE